MFDVRCLFAALCALLFALSAAPAASAEEGRAFQLLDVFELEWASDPQLSPDGERIVFERRGMDVMRDRSNSRLWSIGKDGTDLRPLTPPALDARAPRFSPDGERLAFVARDESGRAQIWMHWLRGGASAVLTQLPAAPRNLAFSPDGRWLAFNLFVEEKPEPFVELPKKPDGAEWAPEAVVIDREIYRADGSGYLKPGFSHLFVLPADGGTPRRVTFGEIDHDGAPIWTPDGKSLIFSANRREDAWENPNDSELWEVVLEGAGPDRAPRKITDRFGPDGEPALSPDGRSIAYVGFDDRHQGYQVAELYLVARAGGAPRRLTPELDRSVSAPVWAPDGEGIYVQFDDHGNGKIGYVPLAGGGVEVVTGDVGGLSLGRPYGGAQFVVGGGGTVVFTHSRPDHPADLAVIRRGDREARRLTRLNDDLLATRELGAVEEILFESSADGRQMQGWVVKPPGFEEGKRYPLLLEIHGGPFSNYGDRFAAEIQLYAAAGYVVLYTNPRGSTSYGEEFGNLIHHNYPSQDYDDLMSGVDAVIAKGYIDPERLYVTGGSGGGVLTAWIVGKTNRFRAAVSAKPVIHWTSFALTADSYNFFHQYWFAGLPWEMPMEYWKRSPLSLVGNVETPTMLLTGEADYRTPISESEQYYQALQLRGIDTMLVRIPEASHGITSRPSHLMSKVAHILAWFEKYR